MRFRCGAGVSFPEKDASKAGPRGGKGCPWDGHLQLPMGDAGDTHGSTCNAWENRPSQVHLSPAGSDCPCLRHRQVTGDGVACWRSTFMAGAFKGRNG